MSLDPNADGRLDRQPRAIPGCALNDAGVQVQRARYAHLAPSVTLVQREPAALQLIFDADFERHTLERALATERQCCPFFHFELSGQRLRVTVDDDAYRPALDALASAFEGARRVGGRR